MLKFLKLIYGYVIILVRGKSGTLSESLQKQKSLYGKDPVQRGWPAYGTNAGR